jgi:hypothetical protein
MSALRTDVEVARAAPRRATNRRAWWAVAAYLVTLAALQVVTAWVNTFDDATKLDLRWGYSHDDVVGLLGDYGADGRVAYGIHLAIDTAYPVAVGLATILLAAVAFGRRRWLWVAPLVFMVLDVVENVLVGVMVATYPAVSQALVAIAAPITFVKLASFFPTMAVLIVSAVVTAVRWPRGRPTAIGRIMRA